MGVSLIRTGAAAAGLFFLALAGAASAQDIRTLAPGASPAAAALQDMHGIVGDWVAKDAAALLQVLPRQIRWMFRKFNSNDFAFEIKSRELDDIRRQLDVNGRRMSLSVVAAVTLTRSEPVVLEGKAPVFTVTESVASAKPLAL